MIEFNRRKFLTTICCLTATSITCRANVFGSKNIDSNDFEQINLYWQRNEAIQASTYLFNRRVNDLSSQSDIKILVANDFAQDNVVSVNGLMLSKTEAAVIVSCFGNV